ncbi:MAG: DUF6155 family protein [Owenweeksia sp.]|nr:DUF6155 family protein [Owenweeksia sp.]
MSLRELKMELQKQSKADLIKHIAELYKKYKPLKEYFSFYMHPDEKALLEEYKQKVYEGFYPKRGEDIKLAVARKAINAFKKLGASEEKQVELELYFVQCGVDILNDYGDMWEAFYTSMENTYDRALSKAAQLGILDKVKPYAQKINEEGQDKGWGFSDFIYDAYFQHYPEDLE